MDYYQINYKKLENIHQIRYSFFIGVFILIITIIVILSFINYAYDIEEFYGIYNDNILTFKINTKLSDKLKKENILSFNNKEVNYKILEFKDYEIINNEIYEIVELKIDGDFYQNEVGIIKIYFDKKRIIFHILDLFK
jgi:hypothetical protein